jgi:hypothetical protein
MSLELALVPGTRWFQAPVRVTTVPWEPVCVPGTFQEPGGATRPGTLIANEYEAQRRHRIRPADDAIVFGRKRQRLSGLQHGFSVAASAIGSSVPERLRGGLGDGSRSTFADESGDGPMLFEDAKGTPSS